MSQTPLDDTELMRLIGNGDAKAYQRVVDEHLGAVHYFALRLLGQREEAEDVAQETFLRLWQHAHRYQPQAKVRTWLYTIAHNAAIDRLRKRRESFGDDVDLVPDSGRPSTLLDQKRTAEAVEEALNTLVPSQRAAITLVHYQGLSGAETAKALGVGVEAVESLLARARRKLRTLLGTAYATPSPQLDDTDSNHG